MAVSSSTEPGCCAKHDLNRAALEITALQQAPPQVLLLQSVTASVADLGSYGDCLEELYTALAFTGLKIGFVTERQLEAAMVPPASAQSNSAGRTRHWPCARC